MTGYEFSISIFWENDFEWDFAGDFVPDACISQSCVECLRPLETERAFDRFQPVSACSLVTCSMLILQLGSNLPLSPGSMFNDCAASRNQGRQYRGHEFTMQPNRNYTKKKKQFLTFIFVAVLLIRCSDICSEYTCPIHTNGANTSTPR